MDIMKCYSDIHITALTGLDKNDQVESGANLKDVGCVLRFPFFNKKWSGDSIDLYEDDTLNHFPDRNEVLTMLAADDYNSFPKSPGDRHFWESLRNCAAVEIYFLDAYFSAANLARLSDVIDYMDGQIDRGETRICIYTCSGDEWEALKKEFEKRHDKYARLEKVSLAICCIEKNMAKKMHDRFVLLGKSLWHFGASAGAMHTNINAYSGPWPDNDGKCIEFMRNLREHHVANEVSTMRKGMRQ